MNAPKRILVTGGRSPVALEWTRRLARNNCVVIGADTSRLTITRFSRYHTSYETYASPRTDIGQFIRDLTYICEKHGIDMVIPTCEELFWIPNSRIGAASVFYPGQTTARLLHDKLYLLKLSNELDIPTLPTWMSDDIPTERGSWIVKPRFTRSGFNVRKIKGKIEKNTVASNEIVQSEIQGEHLCYTGIAVKGKIVAEVCYVPVVRIKKNKGDVSGPAVAFRAIRDPELTNQARKIIQHLNYSGVLGLDAIRPPSSPPVIHDINPRTTSGIHLLNPELDFAALLQGKSSDYSVPEGRTAWIPFAACFSDTSYGDIYRARRNRKWIDVITSHRDPMPAAGQLAALLQLTRLGRRYKRSPMTAATIDIEWNGEYDY